MKVISVKKKQDFKKVYSQGKYAADDLFVAYALVNGLDQNRIGITVSKKVGSAVVRNRVKRWVKESYRFICVDKYVNKTNKKCYDFVVVARAPAGKLIGKGSFNKVDKSVKQLFERLGKKVGFNQ